MGLFSDVVADSRPRPALAAQAAGPFAAPSDGIGAETEFASELTGSTMSLGVEERPVIGPRQGVDPSSPQEPVAAVSRTAKVVNEVFRHRKGKRSREQETTDGQNIDRDGNEENEVLEEQN